MHRKTYNYNGNEFDVSLIPDDSGELILSINAFPIGFTAYFDRQGTQDFLAQVQDAVIEAQIAKEAA